PNRNTSCPIRRRAMKPSLSAWAKRNHGQKAIASTGKDLRTGLETFWYDPRDNQRCVLRDDRFAISSA
ncbi:MAG TPA: hypothetical protein VIH87_11150, partial [Methylocella sp.]